MRALHDHGREALLEEDLGPSRGIGQAAAVDDALDGTDELFIAEAQNLAAKLRDLLLPRGQEQILDAPCRFADDLARNVPQNSNPDPACRHPFAMIAASHLAP